MPPVPVVSVSVPSVLISVPPLISACVAALVTMFMTCAASIIPVICWRRAAAVTPSFWGLAPQTLSDVGLFAFRLLRAMLQASGAQSVEQEAFVGAP